MATISPLAAGSPTLQHRKMSAGRRIKFDSTNMEHDVEDIGVNFYRDI